MTIKLNTDAARAAVKNRDVTATTAKKIEELAATSVASANVRQGPWADTV